jgi:hypothetical protein
MILDAARGLDPSRTVTMECLQPVAAKLALHGAADVPGVGLVIRHER